MNSLSDNAKCTRTRFTRMCIAEAIVALMQTCPFPEITVSAIAKKAGVSRQTFYNYYVSPEDALKDYFQEIITEYMLACSSHPEIGHFQDYSHIVFSLTFFDGYANYFLTLANQGFHTILFDEINKFMLEQFSENIRHTVYEMYCYAGGLLNTFLQWEENGKKESVEEIATILYQLYHARI